MSRTGALVSSSVAALVAVALWVLSGTTSLAWREVAGLAQFVPPTGGALQRAGGNTAAWLVGIVVLAAVVAALTVPIARPGTGGWPVVVLAGWFAAVAGGGLAALARAELTTPAGAQIEAVTNGGYWGVVWGWAVGLGVVLVQRRPARAAAPPTEHTSRRAAGTAALLGGLGWLVVGGLRTWADGSVDLSDPPAVGAHADASPWIATLLPVPAGWWARMVTGGTPRLWLGAVVVVLVQGGLAYVAARTMHRRLGHTAFAFAVWFGAIAASVVATAAMYAGATTVGMYQGAGAGALSTLVQAGGQFGVQYGWIGALVALAVVRVADRRERSAAEPTDEVVAAG